MKNNYLKSKPDIREKAIEHGIRYTFDEELLMLVLGAGTKEMPVEMLACKIQEVLLGCNGDEVITKLMELKGIGKGKALAVAAALELGRRWNNHLRAPIRQPDDLIPFVRNYAVSEQEHFLVVTLNGGHEIINIHCVSVGTINRTLIHPREVFNIAIKENATSLIVCHNHPSGNVAPSKDDIETTQMLLDASFIIGIAILDHIIISMEDSFSFASQGLLFSDDE